MNYSSFLVTSLRLSMYSIVLSANSNSFTSSFPNWIPFITFSPLIAMVMTSKTMLTKSGESGHPCLIPDFRVNAFRFSPLSIMLAIGLSYRALLCSGMVPPFPLSGELFLSTGVEFCPKIFLYLLKG